MFETFKRKINLAINGIEVIGNGKYRKTGLLESIHGHHQMKNMARMIDISYRPETVLFTIGEAKRPPVDANLKGGMIVFSTDVNANSEGKGWIAKIKSYLETLYNRITVIPRVKKTVLQHSMGLSIGRFFRGVYISDKGKRYDENSLSIEVTYTDSKTLELIATEIAKEFNQETVMVKDFNNGETYFADREDISPTKMESILQQKTGSSEKNFYHG